MTLHSIICISLVNYKFFLYKPNPDSPAVSVTLAMTTLIVFFKLKSDADRAEYERWAATTDLPTVRGLDNCERFDVYRAGSLLGSDAAPPCDYVEIIDVTDLAAFRKETASETMRRVAAEFRELVDNPVFVVTERLEA